MKAPGAFLMWETVCFRQGVNDWHAAGSPRPLPVADQTPGGGSALSPGVSQPKGIAMGGHVPCFTDSEGNKGLLMAPVKNSFFVWGYLSSAHVIVPGFLVTVVAWTAYRVFYLWMLTFLWRLSMKYITTSLLIEELEWLHKSGGSQKQTHNCLWPLFRK